MKKNHNYSIISIQKIIILLFVVTIFIVFTPIKANGVTIVDASVYGNPIGSTAMYSNYGHYGGALDGTVSGITYRNSGGHTSTRSMDIGQYIYFNSDYTLTISASNSDHSRTLYASADGVNWVYLVKYSGKGQVWTFSGLNQTYRYFEARCGSNDSIGVFAVKIDLNDTTPPTLALTKNTAGWTNSNVTITATGSDSAGVESIQTPDGNWTNSSSVNYTVSANGTYTFTVKDISGLTTTNYININNIETTAPTATSVVIQNQDENGYDIYVYGVFDTTSDINRVQFPTWTDYGGQDDLAPSWWGNSAVSGTNLGGGTWMFHVNKSSHNNELGVYHTDIYVYDNAGNYNPLCGYQTTLKWDDDANIISNDIPTSMEAGKLYTVYVTVQNTGNKTWDGNYRLGAIGDSDPLASARQYLPTGTTVAPGGSYTFTFTMTAPKNPGTYTTDWRMVHDGVTWFGSYISKNITIIDTTPSTLTFSPSSFTASNPGWTNQPETISISATDSGSGVKNITLPNGNVVTSSTVNYIVSKDGTYTFAVTDNTGNVVSKDIVISNIDMSLPTVTITESTSNITNKNITLNIVANDNLSGIKSITLPDGTIINSSTTTYNVNTNGNYSFIVEDYAGNKITSSFTVSNIISINEVSGIDHIEYKLDGATIQDWAIYPGSLSITNEGITTISARAIDKAGNVSNIATSIVKLDRSKPINSSIQIIIK